MSRIGSFGTHPKGSLAAGGAHETGTDFRSPWVLWLVVKTDHEEHGWRPGFGLSRHLLMKLGLGNRNCLEPSRREIEATAGWTRTTPPSGNLLAICAAVSRTLRIAIRFSALAIP